MAKHTDRPPRGALHLLKKGTTNDDGLDTNMAHDRNGRAGMQLQLGLSLRFQRHAVSGIL